MIRPGWPSVVEILFYIAATFAPIAAASYGNVSDNSAQPRGDFLTSFASYFAAGELTLFTLGICGSILFTLLFSPPGQYNKIMKLLIPLIILLMAYCYTEIGKSPGFDTERPDWVIVMTVAAYVLALIFWGITLVAKNDHLNREGGPDPRGQRAKSLIERSRDDK